MATICTGNGAQLGIVPMTPGTIPILLWRRAANLPITLHLMVAILLVRLQKLFGDIGPMSPSRSDQRLKQVDWIRASMRRNELDLSGRKNHGG